MVYAKIGCTRKAVVQTTTVLLVFIILFSCTLAILSAKRHVINYYFVQEQILATKGKIRECKLNAALDFLSYIDNAMLTRNILSCEELLEIIDDKIFYKEYEDEVFSISFQAYFSLKGFSKERLYELPEYNGSKFYGRINYRIQNKFGVGVYGEDIICVPCNIDFMFILDRVRLAQEMFENQMFSRLSKNATLDEITGLVYEYNELIKDSTGCEIVLHTVIFESAAFMIYYKIVYSIFYESIFIDGASNKISLYCDRVLMI